MSGAIEESGRSSRVPQRVLGRTGLQVSCLAFGAGPVSGLMTGDNLESQSETLKTLYDSGINWIDTAAGYGNGSSERSIGRVLAMLPIEVSREFHVAIKFGSAWMPVCKDFRFPKSACCNCIMGSRFGEMTSRVLSE